MQRRSVAREAAAYTGFAGGAAAASLFQGSGDCVPALVVPWGQEEGGLGEGTPGDTDPCPPEALFQMGIPKPLAKHH